jgi:hypothetical protein
MLGFKDFGESIVTDVNYILHGRCDKSQDEKLKREEKFFLSLDGRY